MSARLRFTACVIAICVVLHGSTVHTQQRGGTAKTDSVQPVNSGANPYRVIADERACERRTHREPCTVRRP